MQRELCITHLWRIFMSMTGWKRWISTAKVCYILTLVGKLLGIPGSRYCFLRVSSLYRCYPSKVLREEPRTHCSHHVRCRKTTISRTCSVQWIQSIHRVGQHGMEHPVHPLHQLQLLLICLLRYRVYEEKYQGPMFGLHVYNPEMWIHRCKPCRMTKRRRRSLLLRLVRHLYTLQICADHS